MRNKHMRGIRVYPRVGGGAAGVAAGATVYPRVGGGAQISGALAMYVEGLSPRGRGSRPYVH